MSKTLNKSAIVLVVLIVAGILIVIFAGLFSIAAGIQTLFNSYLGMSFYEPPPVGIFNYMVATMIVNMAGPPLSWGAAILNAINPNWWLNSYMSWYVITLIVGGP
nr:hypothetical protein [Candidatus Freyarchaeota archaeon]